MVTTSSQAGVGLLRFTTFSLTHSPTSHYFVNGGWFESDNYLIDNVESIRHIPATIVQGRYDIVTPMKTAWDLHKVQSHMQPWRKTIQNQRLKYGAITAQMGQ